MFKNPKQLAHLSFVLVIVGLALDTITRHFIDPLSPLIGLALALYFAAFPFSARAIMQNWRVPKEQRLELFGFVEVGLGLLPFFITVILVIYSVWIIGRQ